jgi:hypothetical protein
VQSSPLCRLCHLLEIHLDPLEVGCAEGKKANEMAHQPTERHRMRLKSGNAIGGIASQCKSAPPVTVLE